MRSDIDGLRAIAILSVILYHLSFYNLESQFLNGDFKVWKFFCGKWFSNNK